MAPSQFLKLKRSKAKKRLGKLQTDVSTTSNISSTSLTTTPASTNHIDPSARLTAATETSIGGSQSAPSSPHSVSDPLTLASPRPGKQTMFRALNQLTTRTFYSRSLPRSAYNDATTPSSSSPSTPSPALSQQFSPVSTSAPKVSLLPPPVDEGKRKGMGEHLADPPGPEAYVSMCDQATAEVGTWTAAGWQMIADSTGGTGIPVRARKANQDSYAASTLPCGRLCLAVFDGHGMHGREASQLVRDSVLQRLSSVARRRAAVARVMHTAFVDAERALRDPASGVDHAFSGTTGTALLYNPTDRDLFCAWAGDSRALLLTRTTARTKWAIRPISADHKPTRRDEKRRIRAAGGRVTRFHHIGPLRVWLPDEWLPGLAMTKSIGDTVLSRYGVTAAPDVTYTRLPSAGHPPCDEREEDQDQLDEADTIVYVDAPEDEKDDDVAVVVVASDGVWEFMHNDDVARFVLEQRASGATAQSVAQGLVEAAVLKWQQLEAVVDDTTAVVAYIPLADMTKLNNAQERGEDAGPARSNSKHERGRFGGFGRRMRRLRRRPESLMSPPDSHGATDNGDDDGELIPTGRPMLVGSNGRLTHFDTHDDDAAKPAAAHTSTSISSTADTNSGDVVDESLDVQQQQPHHDDGKCDT